MLKVTKIMQLSYLIDIFILIYIIK